MANLLTHVEIQNYRSLASISLDPGPVCVLFGPNGAGKSSFLDILWFLRDCAIRGVEQATASRSHGIGVRWIRADLDAPISIVLETPSARYIVEMGYASGRIEPFVGEKLFSKNNQTCLIERLRGSSKADFYHSNSGQMASVTLREPEKLALTRYVDLEDTAAEAVEMDKLLRYVHLYEAREADIFALKLKGSESSHETWLRDRGQNLWSVVRNLKDKRGLDDRYDTIISFMKKSFPSDFQEIYIEQTGPLSVYGSFQEVGISQPIQASGVSDGHLQMLIHLTSLFSEGRDHPATLLFDEPEMSLHPLALATFAEAVQLATCEWSKQVFIATHSPVLMSQFETSEIYAVQKQKDRSSAFNRVSDMVDLQGLLQEYAIGSLYMAELIAPQSVND